MHACTHTHTHRRTHSPTTRTRQLQQQQEKIGGRGGREVNWCTLRYRPTASTRNTHTCIHPPPTYYICGCTPSTHTHAHTPPTTTGVGPLQEIGVSEMIWWMTGCRMTWHCEGDCSRQTLQQKKRPSWQMCVCVCTLGNVTDCHKVHQRELVSKRFLLDCGVCVHGGVVGSSSHYNLVKFHALLIYQYEIPKMVQAVFSI